MAATAAFLSTLKIGSTTINNVKSADFGPKIASLDVTSFSASTPGTETYIGGLLGMQFKFSGQYDKGDSGQSTVETDFFARTTASFVYSPDGTHTYTFTGLITDYNVKSDVKNPVTVDITVQLIGGITAAEEAILWLLKLHITRQ